MADKELQFKVYQEPQIHQAMEMVFKDAAHFGMDRETFVRGVITWVQNDLGGEWPVVIEGEIVQKPEGKTLDEWQAEFDAG